MVVNLWGGYKDRENRPWSKDTLINVFSTTKAITATCFLQLVERGKVDLGALVGDYWPEYACNGKEKLELVIFMPPSGHARLQGEHHLRLSRVG